MNEFNRSDCTVYTLSFEGKRMVVDSFVSLNRCTPDQLHCEGVGILTLGNFPGNLLVVEPSKRPQPAGSAGCSSELEVGL